MLHVPALALQRVGRERLRGAERVRVQEQFRRLFHDHDQLRGRQRIAPREQSMSTRNRTAVARAAVQ
jgi:hypothetical protein